MIDEDDVARLGKMAGLTIDPAFLAGVTQNLRALVDKGALLTDPPLVAEIEPAEALRL